MSGTRRWLETATVRVAGVVGVVAPLMLVAACTVAHTNAAESPSGTPSTRASTGASQPPYSPPDPGIARTSTRPTPGQLTTPDPAAHPKIVAQALPDRLGYSTGNATQVITVQATSTASTTATLQAWSRTRAGWTAFTPAVLADLGTDGMSTHPSESISATPMGSFTLTEAFGRDPNPGTSLPYRPTTPADWWISEPGPLYNTFQTCAGTMCPFALGEPNEHLYETLPYYAYALVIDYNRSPVVQGAGSAFFVHVTVGEPTQGCVSIPESYLVTLLRWLSPAAHPRILIGTGA
ncbi:MAG: hypothetical protein M3O28_00795 [Actinomycetota bacterium]|nr:hypothetical protein [Actinomycetota bacterium]